MNNSRQARKDYTRHDEGPIVREVTTQMLQPYFQSLMMDFYRANVSVSDISLLEIEAATRGQSIGDDTNNIWMTEGHKRITSSVTGQILKQTQPK